MTKSDVQVVLTALGRTPERDGKPVSASTVTRVHATLRTALNAAVRRGVIPTDPASRVELPAARRPRAVVWTSARVEQCQRTGSRPVVAVWTGTHTSRLLQASQVTGSTPCTTSSRCAAYAAERLSGLRWCDLDLDAGVATINQQLQQYDGHLVIGPPKTNRSCRIVALDRSTVAALCRHRQRQLAERDTAGTADHDTGYVFTTLRGDPVAPDRISRLFRALSANAGLPPIRLHDLRHGAASRALAAGVDLRVVQDTPAWPGSWRRHSRVDSADLGVTLRVRRISAHHALGTPHGSLL